MTEATLTCDLHGKSFKNRTGYRVHMERAKGHRSEPALAPQIEEVDDEPLVPPVVVQTAPFTPGAVRYNDPEGPKNWSTKGMRGIKMSFPRHDECQAEDKGPGWWYRCEAKGHQPYFTPDHYGEKIVEELGPPNADGNQEVLKTKTIKVKIPGSPNLKQIPLTGRHNADENTAMRKARGEGCRLPEELGLAPRCQFWNCWVKLNTRATDLSGNGGYCEENHRKASNADRNGTFLEQLNEKKKGVQWATL